MKGTNKKALLHSALQVAAFCLISFNGFKQCLKVTGTEPLMIATLNNFEEQC